MSGQESNTEAHTRRRELHRQYFNRLCELKWELEDLQGSTLGDELLRSLSIHRLEDLDVDESATCDFGTRYFAPLATDRTPEVIEQAQDYADLWHWRCVAGTDEAKRRLAVSPLCELCDKFHEAVYTLDWFYRAYRGHFSGWHSAVDFGEWKTARMVGKDELPSFRGEFPDIDSTSPAYQRPGFRGEVGLFVADKSKPHAMCYVADSELAADTEVLRSEILTAVTMLKRQTRGKEFIDHHTLPVLVFTFQHDNAVRITQAHFDGERLFLRTSRSLVLGDELGGDMYLLARWMSSRPAGITLYSAPACTSDDSKRSENMWKRLEHGVVTVRA